MSDTINEKINFILKSLFFFFYKKVLNSSSPYFVALFCIFTSIRAHQEPLVVILMVKNEAECIAQTLTPFVQAGVDAYIILDTGSIDTTINTTKQFFASHNIQHGYIIEQPFVTRSGLTNRNGARSSP